jgi:hypothetical protein
MGYFKAIFQSGLEGLGETKVLVHTYIVRNPHSNESDTYTIELICSIAIYFVTITTTLEYRF